jgi:hypothetical protein
MSNPGVDWVHGADNLFVQMLGFPRQKICESSTTDSHKKSLKTKVAGFERPFGYTSSPWTFKLMSTALSAAIEVASF